MESLLLTRVAKVTADESEVGQLFLLLGGEIEIELAPAFAFDADPLATGFEEELDFCFRERGIADLEIESEVEPIHP